MKKAVYLIVAFIVFFFSLGAIDYWIFRWYEGSIAIFNYWLAVGIAFISFGVCLAVVMWISNPKTEPKVLGGIAVTPFILFVAGIWDWIIYFIYLYYGTAYSYLGWSAQERWIGTWTQQLQLIWTIACVIGLIVMWLKILGKKG